MCRNSSPKTFSYGYAMLWTMWSVNKSAGNSIIWQSILQSLGPVFCSLFSFLQTMVVLTNSIMLVCIAFDRYMAILRILKGSWEPSKLFCIACCTIIWGFSAAISSPLISIYEFHRVYVIPEPEKRGDELTYYIGYMCASDKVRKWEKGKSNKFSVKIENHFIDRKRMDIILQSCRLLYFYPSLLPLSGWTRGWRKKSGNDVLASTWLLWR